MLSLLCSIFSLMVSIHFYFILHLIQLLVFNLKFYRCTIDNNHWELESQIAKYAGTILLPLYKLFDV